MAFVENATAGCNAVLRSIAAADVIGARAMIVAPADEEARGFYERYGFRDLPGTGRMYVPITRA